MKRGVCLVAGLWLRQARRPLLFRYLTRQPTDRPGVHCGISFWSRGGSEASPSTLDRCVGAQSHVAVEKHQARDMGEILRRVQVYRLSSTEKVAAVSAVGPAATVPPASEPAELVTMRVVILLGGVAVGIGMFAIFWAWCYAEHRLWQLESAAAPPAGDSIDQPLLAAHEEQQECCSCPMDALEAQQQRSDEAARAASLGVPTDSTSSVPSVDSTSSLAPAPAAAAAASSSREGEEEVVTAAVQPIRPLLRDFTIAELNTFDGGESPLSRKPHPIFISLRGTVYDASNGRGIYGPSGELAAFAGHDVSRWVARGLVASEDDGKSDLDDLSLKGLNRIERMTLAGWEERFMACGYPVVGRVVLQ